MSTTGDSKTPPPGDGGGWAPFVERSPADASVGSDRVLTVAGERFRVRLRPRHGPVYEYDYTWLTGPNHGYGFAVGGPLAQGVEEQRATIRDFLAKIDPVTGYLRED